MIATRRKRTQKRAAEHVSTIPYVTRFRAKFGIGPSPLCCCPLMLLLERLGVHQVAQSEETVSVAALKTTSNAVECGQAPRTRSSARICGQEPGHLKEAASVMRYESTVNVVRQSPRQRFPSAQSLPKCEFRPSVCITSASTPDHTASSFRTGQSPDQLPRKGTAPKRRGNLSGDSWDSGVHLVQIETLVENSGFFRGRISQWQPTTS